MSETVIDNTARNRYEMNVDGVVAFIDYTRSHAAVSFDHTEVPASLAGKGIGSRLARGALQLARKQGVKVIPRCSFIADFVGKHAEFKDIISADVQ